MFYYLAKIVWFVLQPSTLLTSLTLHGLALTFTRFARAGRLIGLPAISLLLIAGLSPLGNALLIPLEDRFAPPAADAEPPHGIIVLGGSFDAAASTARQSAELNEAAERLTTFAELARRYPRARLVFSGGGLIAAGETEARAARRLLHGLGVDQDRVVYEDRSRDTHENAVFTLRLIEPRPGQTWWLITSAYHMPRAVGGFRMAGLDVTPYPVDYRTRGRADLWRGFASVSAGLRRVDIAAREWIGLIAYRLSGRTAALLP